MKKALAALTAFVMVFGAGVILSGVSGEPSSLISASADVNTEIKGKCGNNLQWSLDDEGTLYISKIEKSGSGKMNNNFSSQEIFSSNKGKIKHVRIGDGVENISDYAFDDCRNLETISFDDSGSVKSIGVYSFRNCIKLTGIKIPDGVTSIGDGAFSGCERLANVNIPDSVTSIGGSAFTGCSKLTSIKIPDGIAFIEEETFAGCSSLRSITIPDSVTEIGNNAFYYCPGLTSITIPDSVKSIGDQAFYDCVNIKNVTIPDSVTEIGKFAFGYSKDSNHNVYKVDGFEIFCNKGTAGEEYAKKYGFDYELTEKTKAISDCTITLSQTSYTYDGTKKTPKVTVKDGEKTLTNGTDYTVSYSDNTKAGTAKVTVTGIGNYSGTKTVKFTISPSKAELTGDTNGDGSITVTDISKIAAHVKGKKSLTPDEQKRADANGDGSITVTDISKVAAHVKGVKSIS